MRIRFSRFEMGLWFLYPKMSGDALVLETLFYHLDVGQQDVEEIPKSEVGDGELRLA